MMVMTVAVREIWKECLLIRRPDYIKWFSHNTWHHIFTLCIHYCTLSNFYFKNSPAFGVCIPIEINSNKLVSPVSRGSSSSKACRKIKTWRWNVIRWIGNFSALTLNCPNDPIFTTLAELYCFNPHLRLPQSCKNFVTYPWTHVQYNRTGGGLHKWFKLPVT